MEPIETPANEPETAAAVDLGSNSFHLVVAQVIGGELRVVDRLRESVRLAAGLDDNNELCPKAQHRALECLRRFGQRLRGMPVDRVRIVGTNTLRKARNSSEFLGQASDAIGHPIEVISGLEEARLIYLGVSHSLPESTGHHLVVDIGGGSTELIIGKRFESIFRESLYMGCVSYSRQYFPNGVITAERMRRALIAARLELKPVAAAYRRLGWSDAIGASGTVKSAGEVIRQMGWSDSGITLATLQRLRDALITTGRSDRLDLRGLKEERKEVLPGGVAVLIATFEALGIEHMQVSDWALREGLLYDLVGRIRHEDVRERTIASLSERYQVDLGQARRVTDAALACLRQVADVWRLHDEEAHNLLTWAGQLHEIGLTISHSQHHKHAGYLIENSDMPGFSREDQSLLAAIVRGYRRKFPTAVFKSLPKVRQQRAQCLAILLRIAATLYRGRTDEPLPYIELTPGERALQLKFPAGWLDENPLTRADLEGEAEFLLEAKFKLGFV